MRRHGIAADDGRIIGAAGNEALRVFAVALLFCIVGQLTRQTVWMGEVHDHQILDHFWHRKGDLPSNRSTQVVTDDGGLVVTFSSDDGCDICNEIVHGVGGNTVRLATEVVAPLIHGDDSKVVF